MFVNTQHCWQHYITHSTSKPVFQNSSFLFKHKKYRWYMEIRKFSLVVRQQKVWGPLIRLWCSKSDFFKTLGTSFFHCRLKLWHLWRVFPIYSSGFQAIGLLNENFLILLISSRLFSRQSAETHKVLLLPHISHFTVYSNAFVRDFRLPPQCNWDRSSGMLLSVDL